MELFDKKDILLELCTTYLLRDTLLIGRPKVKTFWGSLDATNDIALVFFVIWLFTLRYSEKVRKRKRKKKRYISEKFYESMISLTNKRSKLLSKALDNKTLFFEILISSFSIILIVMTALKMFVFGIIVIWIFPHSYWIRRDTPCLSVLSPNWGKCGPE